MTVFDAISERSRNLIRKRSQPRWTPPMLAALTEKRFSHPDWIFERKYDGVRCLVFRRGEDVRLMSRTQKPLNNMFPELVEPILKQRCGDFIIDGEIVTFDGPHTSFGKLQARLGVIDPRKSRIRAKDTPVFLYVFDVMHVEGHDVTQVPLVARKELLKRLVDFCAGNALRFSDHREEHGEKFLDEACRDGWEGIIAKRADSPYKHGRSRDWLKFKCVSEQEFVVVGFTDPQGSRIGFGALLVGYYDPGGRLHYAGKVGTGYDDATLRILSDHLKKIERRTPPVAESDSSLKNPHWIDPRLVAQVGFTEWTGEGRLRHPRFLGLRFDKQPKNVVRERPVE